MLLTYVFCDGPDSIGKSTICNNILNGRILNHDSIVRSLCLPSDTGPLKFIRDKVKSKEFQTDNFSRQLLHCCSHIHAFESEAYRYLSEHKGIHNEYVIFDRGPLSTLVYGSLLISNPEFVDMLVSINTEVLNHLLYSGKLDYIYFINLTRDTPYRSEDDSYYEQQSKFETIRDKYIELIPRLKTYFGEFHVKFFDIDLSKEFPDAKPEVISDHIETMIYNCRRIYGH